MKKRTVSIFMCFVLTLTFVLGSFSVAFADNNKIYKNTNGEYTFEELLYLYLDNVVGYGSLFDSYSCFLYYSSIDFTDGFTRLSGGSVLSYYEQMGGHGGTGESLLEFILGLDAPAAEEARAIEDVNGFNFYLFPDQSAVVIGTTVTKYVHYFSGATGNRLETGGCASGVGRPKDYYTQPGTDNTLPNSGHNYYEGDTTNTTIIDNSTGDFNNIGDGTIITGDNATTIYNPETSTYYTMSDNRVYTTNNYYTYNTVNYYMPGSDQPLNTWNYYYELPDGRNSATLTEEDIAGLNLDFDVVNYKQATEDLTQKALFHFDGNIDNSAPPSNRGLVPGANVFNNNFVTPRNNWYSVGSDVYADSGESQSYNYNKITNVFTMKPTTALWYSTSVFFFNTGLTASDYLIECEIDGLEQLPTSAYVTLALIDRNDYNGFLAGSTQFTNTSNGKVSVLASLTSTNFQTNWGLYVQYSSNFSGVEIKISNISVRPVEWQYSDTDTFNSAEFEFTQNASYTFVDTQTPFNAALYLDGTEHEAWIQLPDDSFQSASDFTYSFRWYQEKSTSNVTHYIRLGRAKNTDLNCVYFTFNGSQLLLLGSYNNSGHQQSQINNAFLVGQWNTVTLVRTGNTLLLYLNGLQIASLSDSNMKFGGEYIQLDFAADDNVHYLDEILFATQSLYTENHVPRLIPWDTTNVLVLPEVTENSIAVMATIPITGYRIGGVRPTFPNTGMVWMLVEGDYITSIQIYNGYMWVEIGGAVYYNGHWYQLENFNIHVTYDDIDTPPNSDVVNPNKPSGGGSGSGSGGSGGGWLDTLFQELLSGVVDLIVEAIRALIGLIENVLGAVADFIGACFSVITIPLELMQPMGDFIGGLFAIFPSEIQLVYTAGFALIILCSVIMWISGRH